jgi:GGDEF domain-containing protein
VVERRDSIRSDLIVGVVSGLGLSAALWSLVLAPPRIDPATLAFLIGGSIAGGATIRLPRLGRIAHAFPVALAAVMIGGPGLAMASAILCGVVAWTTRLIHREPHTLRSAALDIGSTAARTGAACLVFIWVAGNGGGTPLGMIAFGVTDRILDRLGALVGNRFTDGHPRESGPPWIDLLRAALVVVAGGSAAWLLTRAFVDPSLRPYLAAIPLTLAAQGMRRLLIDMSARRRESLRAERSRLRSIARAISRTVCTSSGTDQEQAENIHLHCVAIGERMGLTPQERDAIGYASLLVEAGLILDPDPDDELPEASDEMLARKSRPGASAELTRGLRFPAPTEEYVRHAREHWNGLGYPGRLRGEEIPIGSRIIAAVSWYHARRVAEGNDFDPAALTRRLLTEAGERFDPIVVDRFLEHLRDMRLLLERHEVGRKDRAGARTDDAREVSGVEQDLQALYEISRMVDYDLPFEERLSLIGAKLQGLVGFRDMAIFRPEAEGERLRADSTFGPDAERIQGGTVPAGTGPTGRAYVERRAVSGRPEPPKLESVTAESLPDRLSRALSVPLVAGPGECLGSLTIYGEGDQPFPADERHTLVTVAGHLARALSSAGDSESPAAARLTDPLTGLPDARFLALELSHRMLVSDGAPAPRFGMIALRAIGMAERIQHHGIHSAERSLVEIARRLAAAGQANQTLCRYGHGLFVVLTPVQEDGDLISCWDRMLRAARESRPGNTGPELRVVASHAGFPEDGRSVEALLERLDDRLRLAVDDGRGVVPFPVATGSY